MKDRVTFRRWKDSPKTVIAILWDRPANRGMNLMYQHIGQHGEGDAAGVIERTIPATFAEQDVRNLFDELEGGGYELVIVEK